MYLKLNRSSKIKTLFFLVCPILKYPIVWVVQPAGLNGYEQAINDKVMKESKNPESKGSLRTRNIFYWITTGLVTFELIYGALWDFDLVNKGYVRSMMQQLGYPAYYSLILGACKLPAAVVLLVPGWPRLKEWAYAGTFFIFAGAVASHLLARDITGPMALAGVHAGLTIASWALRPQSRKVG
jgi:hypothetical protein